MAFDNGFSLLGLVFVTIIGVYPIAVILCTVFSWMLRKRRKASAIFINLIPMLWVAGIGIPLIFINF